MMYVRCIYTAMSSMQTKCQIYKQKGKHIGYYGLIYVKVSTMQSAFEKCLLVFAIKCKTRTSSVYCSLLYSATRVPAVYIALFSTTQDAFEQCLLLFVRPHKTRSSSVYCSLLYHRRRVRALSIVLCSTHKTHSSTVYYSLLYHARHMIPEDSIHLVEV